MRKTLATALALTALGALADDSDVTVTTNGTKVAITATKSDRTLAIPFFAEDVSTVDIMVNGNLYWYVQEASTYTGGTEIHQGQLRIKHAGTFGTGPVRIGCDYDHDTSNIYVESPDLVIANKIVFGPKGCYIAGKEDSPFTLKCVGYDDAYTGVYRYMTVGRTGEGVSYATLSLTDPATEALDGVNLQGKLSLTIDGGVLKARKHARSPYFSWAKQECATPVCVTTAGFAFDVVEGAETMLGNMFAFDREYVCRETYRPENAGFENGLTGWSIAATAPNTETGEVRANGSAFDTQSGVEWGTTSDPSHYCMLRHDAALSRTINLPQEGLWRVGFWRGCRPETSYSVGIKTQIKIDGELVQEFPALKSTEIHAFKEFLTVPVRLTAGSHTLAIVNVGGNENYHYNYDDVRLERVDDLPVLGPVTKTGAGRLTLDGWNGEFLDLRANAGVLALDGAVLTNASLAVAEGAVASLAFSTVDAGSKVTVASGGTLVLTDFGRNVVQNGDFEFNEQTGYDQQNVLTGWTVTNKLELARTRTPYGGLHWNEDRLKDHFYPTPYGSEAIFLREGVAVFQKVKCPVDGTYVVSLAQSCRKNAPYADGSCRIPVTVTVDDVEAFTTPRHDTVYDFTRYSGEIYLTAGEHVLCINAGEVDKSQIEGNIALVDDVQMRRKLGVPDLGAGELRLAAGSTLRLDNAQTIAVANVFVDDRRIDGGRGALVRAGVTVLGGGKIKAGFGCGAIILFR